MECPPAKYTYDISPSDSEVLTAAENMLALQVTRLREQWGEEDETWQDSAEADILQDWFEALEGLITSIGYMPKSQEEWLSNR